LIVDAPKTFDFQDHKTESTASATDDEEEHEAIIKRSWRIENQLNHSFMIILTIIETTYSNIQENKIITSLRLHPDYFKFNRFNMD